MAGGLTNEQRVAALGDLREFLKIAEEIDTLEVVKDVDPDLELGALYELSLRYDYPPVLLFENIKGFDPSFRVVTNVRASRVLIRDLGMDMVKSLRAGNRRGEGPRSIPPVVVNDGPVFENQMTGDQVNVRAFPAPRWHGLDGGPYIGTECLVITKDPDSDWVNVGTYRVQVQDEKTVSVFIEPGKHGDIIRRKYWARGQACPMIVCVGQAPVLGNVARVQTAPGITEYALAGGRLGRPVELVRGPITGIPMPATAEIALEGHMPPPEEETRAEGPFGEWPGYYADTTVGEVPLMIVKAVYHRDNPIMLGMPPLKPPNHYMSLPLGAAALWDQLESAGIPNVKGVWSFVFGGVAGPFIVIAIEQAYMGHAKQTLVAASGCRAGAYGGKFYVVVDHDVDITKLQD
ncbi:MAG: hypothetical protein QOI12_5285, partial [Alphaproteobacteria bacterium]|nr:hypothetical protein [Alphaproteobacteria bacterium]